MLNFIISAVTNSLRVYLIYRFIILFFGRSEQKKGRVFCVGGIFFVLNLVLFWIFHTAWINVICNLLGIGGMVRLYTKSVKTNLFVTGVIYLINMSCDVVRTLPFIQYEDGRNFNQIYEVITELLILVCLLLAEKIITIHRNVEQIQNVFLIVVPLCSIAVIYYLVLSGTCEETGITVTSLGLLTINYFILFLYNQLLHFSVQKYETELLKQQVQIYMNQLNVILQGEEKMKALRHDLKHHLKELKLLAEQNQAKRISEYINQMEDFVRVPGEIVSSGNMEIDGVLNYMLQRAKEQLKTVKTNVILPEKITYSFDMTVLLGNLLENAIDAARQTEEKFLEVLVEYKQGVLLIKINNSFSGGLKMDRHKFLTTKKSGGDHGIGLTSVKQIVEKYNGILKIDPQGNLFCVKVKLYLS